jgi:hypothetical protein
MMTDQVGYVPDDDDDEGEAATIEEAIENVASGSRSEGAATPPEQAHSGDAPVEQIAGDDEPG